MVVSWSTCHAYVTCLLCFFNFVFFDSSTVQEQQIGSLAQATTDRTFNSSCNGEQATFPRSFSPQSSHISYALLPSFQIFPSQARRHTHTHASLQPRRPSPARRVQHWSTDASSFPEHRRLGCRKVSHQSSSGRLCASRDQPPICAFQPTVTLLSLTADL